MLEFHTILFDLDDTLMDRDKALVAFIEVFKRKYRHSMAGDTLAVIGDLFIRLDAHGYKPREILFGEILESTHWRSIPGMEALLAFWTSEFPCCAAPMPGLYEMLDYFREIRVKMGVVTNGSQRTQTGKIRTLGLDRYLSARILSGEVGLRKPDPAIFQLALDKMEATPASTLYVGDNPDTDILGANNAGIASVWIRNGRSWTIEEYAPTFEIDRLFDLTDGMVFPVADR